MGFFDALAALAAQFSPPPNFQRFDYQVLPTMPDMGPARPGYRWIQEPSGNVSEARFDATPWVDIGYPTQAGDLRALTIKGLGGTSEGDYWDDPSIAAARKIVGSDMSIMPRHVQQFQRFLLDRREPHFMSQHPGLEAY